MLSVLSPSRAHLLLVTHTILFQYQSIMRGLSQILCMTNQKNAYARFHRKIIAVTSLLFFSLQLVRSNRAGLCVVCKYVCTELRLYGGCSKSAFDLHRTLSMNQWLGHDSRISWR